MHPHEHDDVLAPPIAVKIVAQQLPEIKKPNRFSTRALTVSPNNLSTVLRIATENRLRHRMILTTSTSNSGPVYISSRDSQNVNTSYALSTTAMIVLETTAAVYFWGTTAGDMLYVIEESFDE